MKRFYFKNCSKLHFKIHSSLFPFIKCKLNISLCITLAWNNPSFVKSLFFWVVSSFCSSYCLKLTVRLSKGICVKVLFDYFLVLVTILYRGSIMWSLIYSTAGFTWPASNITNKRSQSSHHHIHQLWLRKPHVWSWTLLPQQTSLPTRLETTPLFHPAPLIMACPIQASCSCGVPIRTN